MGEGERERERERERGERETTYRERTRCMITNIRKWTFNSVYFVGEEFNQAFSLILDVINVDTPFIFYDNCSTTVYFHEITELKFVAFFYLMTNKNNRYLWIADV